MVDLVADRGVAPKDRVASPEDRVALPEDRVAGSGVLGRDRDSGPVARVDRVDRVDRVGAPADRVALPVGRVVARSRPSDSSSAP